MFGVFFLGALYLRLVLGYDALQIGLAFLPTTIAMGTMSIRFSEPIISRFGARATLPPGLGLAAAGLALFAGAGVHADYLTEVMPALILIGIGMGGCFPALMTIAMAGSTPEDAGLASGLVNTSAQVGGALGLAVLATLAASRTKHLLAAGHSSAAALTGGYHLAFWIAVALVLSGIALALAVVPKLPARAVHGAPEDAEGGEDAGEPEHRPAAEPVYSEV
jgi:MFS family permease